MMTICGNPRAREGAIVFAGRDITTLPTHEIARLKIAQAPEGRRIFLRMTVLENLQMGATTAAPADFDRDLERVLALFPRLKQRIGRKHWRDKNNSRVGAGLLFSFRHGIKDRPAFMRGAALTRRYATDNVGAVSIVGLVVELAFATSNALDYQPRGFINEYCHVCLGY
jgi:hypothetical protein